MEKYFALAHNYPDRSSIQRTPISAKAGSTSAAISSVDGSIKPAAPITLVTKVQRVVQQIMQYLGVVKVCANIDTPAEVEMLKTTAYVLTLPTSKQLRLIAGDTSDNGGPALAYKSVCQTLNNYNRHARKYNEVLHLTNKLDAGQKTLNTELENQRAQSWATGAGLKEKEQQLAQWNIRCCELRSILQNRTLKRDPDKLKAELKQLKGGIASETVAVEALRQKQKTIESKTRICIKQLDVLHHKGKFAKNVLMSSQLALSDDIKVLDEQLAEALKTPGSGHAGALLALRNGLRDAETLRGLRTDWRYWEMLGVSPAEYDDVSANSAPIQAWLDLRFSAKEALSFKNAGYTDPTKLTYLRGTGATGPIAKQMHAFGYTRDFFPQEVDEKGHQVSAATYGFTLGMHHDAWAENDAVKIGSGACNAPMGGYYMDTAAGAASMQVFKKERFVTVNATDPTDNKPIPLQAGQEHAKPDCAVLPVFQKNELVSTEDLHAPRIWLAQCACLQFGAGAGPDRYCPF